jgi:hypothetical protein
VFYLSVVMGIAVVVTVAYATESPRDPSMRFDVLGQFFSILARLAVSFAIIEGNASGWASPTIIGAFAVFAAALTLFITVERRVAKPMVHLRYFTSRAFIVGLLMVGINNFCFYGIMLLCTDFLQNAQHVSAVTAGFYLMPANLAFFLVNQSSEQFEKFVGERVLIFVATIFMLAGVLWLAMLGLEAGSWEVSAGLFVLGVGLGLMWTPGCAFSMGACSAADQGFASGAIALTRSFFGVLGIAILGTLLAGTMAARVALGLSDAGAPAAAQSVVATAVHHGGAFAIAQRGVDGVDPSMLMRIVEQAFTSGWHVALLFAAALTLLFGIVIYIFIPARKPETARASS